MNGELDSITSAALALVNFWGKAMIRGKASSGLSFLGIDSRRLNVSMTRPG